MVEDENYGTYEDEEGMGDDEDAIGEEDEEDEEDDDPSFGETKRKKAGKVKVPKERRESGGAIKRKRCTPSKRRVN